MFVVFNILAILKYQDSLLTSDFITLENWKGLTTKAAKKCDHIDKNSLQFPLRKNRFGAIDPLTNNYIACYNTCPINSIIHGFSHLEKNFQYLSKIEKNLDVYDLVKKLLTAEENENDLMLQFINYYNLATND